MWTELPDFPHFLHSLDTRIAKNGPELPGIANELPPELPNKRCCQLPTIQGISRICATCQCIASVNVDDDSCCSCQVICICVFTQSMALKQCGIGRNTRQTSTRKTMYGAGWRKLRAVQSATLTHSPFL